MLDMTLDELKDFYPNDEIIREYGDALLKYSEDVFIYPYSEEEEKEMLRNTELDMAYNDGIDVGVEQNKIEIIRSLKDRLSIEEIAVVAKISVAEVERISNLKHKKGIDSICDEALINKVGFYPHCEEKEIEIAYNEGIAAGIEQNKIEMIKNLKDKLSTQEIVDAVKISVAEVDRIFNLKQKKDIDSGDRASIKHSKDVFIYPHSEEEEKQMMHDMEINMAYDEGVEQTKIDVIKNMLELKFPISTIAKSLNMGEDEIEKIIKENNLDKR